MNGLKKALALVLCMVMCFSLLPTTGWAEGSAAGARLADFAYSCIGKTLYDFPESNRLENHWCAWFVTYCASQLGYCGSPSNHTQKLFPPIEESTWGQTNPAWGATGVQQMANWLSANGKAKVYYFGSLDSECVNNSNYISSSKSSITPPKRRFSNI